jgi:hypothetical protein
MVMQEWPKRTLFVIKSVIKVVVEKFENMIYLEDDDWLLICFS